jgi:hypothetical protein
MGHLPGVFTLSVKDSEYVDHLLATNSNRPEVQAIQRHVAWLRSVVAAQGIGITCPDTKRLSIRRSNHPDRNALWVGAAKISVSTSQGVSHLDIEAPAFIKVTRHEVVDRVAVQEAKSN